MRGKKSKNKKQPHKNHRSTKVPKLKEMVKLPLLPLLFYLSLGILLSFFIMDNTAIIIFTETIQTCFCIRNRIFRSSQYWPKFILR